MTSGVQRGRGNRAMAPDIQGRGHPKSGTTEIKMLQQDDFFRCKATNTCFLD